MPSFDVLYRDRTIVEHEHEIIGAPFIKVGKRQVILRNHAFDPVAKPVDRDARRNRTA